MSKFIAIYQTLPLICSAAYWAFSTPVHADSAYEVYALQANQDYLDAANYAALDALAAQEECGMDGRGLCGAVRRPGEVVFVYGSSRPQILCQVLELTDIAFEPGELLQSVQIGDGARWSVQSALSGNHLGAQQHLIIKPFDSGLKTSLVVTTDKRTYHLALKSSLEGFMPMVRFTYPEQELQRMNVQLQQKQDYVARNTVAGTHVTLDELNFKYAISGDEALKPERVFNDGRKTIIELPEQLLRAGQMPALLCVNADGGLFSEDALSTVNYRVQGARYVLDGVPSHLRLLSGDDGLSCDIRLQADA